MCKAGHLISLPTPSMTGTLTGIFKEMRILVAAAKAQEALAAKEVVALKAKLDGFEKRLAYNRSAVPGGRRVSDEPNFFLTRCSRAQQG